MSYLQQGQKIQLNLVLEKGEPNLFPIAILKDKDQVPLAGSPVTLTHDSDGHYINDSITMPNTQEVHATFIVYQDAAHTILSDYGQTDEVFILDEHVPLLQQLISGAIPGQEIEGLLEDDGELTGELDDLDAELVGSIDDQDELLGELLIEDEALIGLLDDPGDTLLGEITC